jgi:hypothetical protein
MFKNQKCKIVKETKEFVILVPLDWNCAKFLNSLNCGGEGAKWCIGSTKTDKHWNKYINDGIIFYCMYFFERHPVFGKKLLIEIKKGRVCFYTQKDKSHNFEFLANYLYDKLIAHRECFL